MHNDFTCKNYAAILPFYRHLIFLISRKVRYWGMPDNAFAGNGISSYSWIPDIRPDMRLNRTHRIAAIQNIAIIFLRAK